MTQQFLSHRVRLASLRLAPVFVAAAGGLFAGCSGGSGDPAEFRVLNVEVQNGETWQINRPIRVNFTRPVDPLSVNLNTFNVRRVGGGPAAGEFFLENENRTIVFQPLCPTLDDLSDAGLASGTDPNNGGAPFEYEVNVIGVDENSQLPIRSIEGEGLVLSQTRTFKTPVVSTPLDLYIDTQVGPPKPLILGEPLPPRVQTIVDADPSITQDAIYCFLEVGGPQGTRHFFQRELNGSVSLVPPVTLPLNQFSDAGSRVELVLNFDQSVNPASANISPNRLRWEFANHVGGGTTWLPLPIDVELERNCGQIGARVRLRPLGVLPSATELRAVIDPTFTDLIGEVNSTERADFALATTRAFPTAPAILADNLLESFDNTDNEDQSATFAEPRAEWGVNGELRPRFSFTGTGGPGGQFDVYIGPGQDVIFNTASSQLSGGLLNVTFNPDNPSIAPVTTFVTTNILNVVGGSIDCRNFYIEQGGSLRVEGPNPFVLLASGNVWIRGDLIASGTSNPGVNTLNTTNQPEPGTPGQAGGGRGGTGSPSTNSSSPRGGTGFGAFNVPELGGQGGEAGWSTTTVNDSRRGSGGGGGVFGPNIAASVGTGPFEQRRIGFDAEQGFATAATTNGALTGLPGPFGGLPGPSPFTDPDPNNNFFGIRFNGSNNTVTVGELTRPWAGAGGGAGGDSAVVPGGVYPPPWNPAGDEKGAGGAGGGGSVQILSLGSVIWGINGRVIARGGAGGSGENVPFGINRVAGGSGGGAGGHVIVQTAGKIDFRAKTGVNLSDLNTVSNTAPGNNWAINVLGGQGGAGAFDGGGARATPSGVVETGPAQDGCPPGHPVAGPNACAAPTNGAGGDGGPGLIQLHTSSGAIGTSSASADVLVAAGVQLLGLCAPQPICPGGSTGVNGFPLCNMVPSFGRTSRTISKWFALGDGGFDESTGTYRDVQFQFPGLNPATGAVLTTAGQVNNQAAIWTAPSVSLGAALPAVANPGGRSLTLLGSEIQNAVPPERDVLLANPALLEGFVIELSRGADVRRYVIAAAQYTAPNLVLTVDSDGPSMLTFPGGLTGVAAAIRPTYFRIASNGTLDALPAPGDVRIRFQATSPDPLTGLPNPAAATALTGDINTFNTASNGNLRFVRFEVLFDIGPLSIGQGVNPIPSLQFVRVPFRYQ